MIASRKRQAQPTWQGGRGYQPMRALWAELDVAVAEPFRDGKVPAVQDPFSVAQRAFAALSETVEEFYCRGDSACYENGLLDWLRNENREKGPLAGHGYGSHHRQGTVRKLAPQAG